MSPMTATGIRARRTALRAFRSVAILPNSELRRPACGLRSWSPPAYGSRPLRRRFAPPSDLQPAAGSRVLCSRLLATPCGARPGGARPGTPAPSRRALRPLPPSARSLPPVTADVSYSVAPAGHQGSDGAGRGRNLGSCVLGRAPHHSVLSLQPTIYSLQPCPAPASRAARRPVPYGPFGVSRDNLRPAAWSASPRAGRPVGDRGFGRWRSVFSCLPVGVTCGEVRRGKQRLRIEFGPRGRGPRLGMIRR